MDLSHLHLIEYRHKDEQALLPAHGFENLTLVEQTSFFEGQRLFAPTELQFENIDLVANPRGVYDFFLRCKRENKRNRDRKITFADIVLMRWLIDKGCIADVLRRSHTLFLGTIFYAQSSGTLIAPWIEISSQAPFWKRQGMISILDMTGSLLLEHVHTIDIAYTVGRP